MFTDEWNNHRIRQSRMAELPSGVPHVLWHFPALHGMTIYNYYYYNQWLITAPLDAYLLVSTADYNTLDGFSGT